MGILTSDRFKPTFFLGLGGHGGTIVNLLAGRLHRHPNWDRISSLTHFICIDTNKDDLDKQREIPEATRFLISAFDQRSYVERKRGRWELPEDRLVTQWLPSDMTFRASQGDGAGQIRMESRLRLWYSLEEDRHEKRIRQTIRRLLDTCTSRENPWRDNENRVVRVLIYGSLAGGTGSGGFLPMAWLMRDMVEAAGWGRPSVTGVLTLPTAFLHKVRPQLHEDIMANGYAALKELEFVTRQLDYAGGPDEIEFHFDPGNPERRNQFVRERPFTIAYIIDRPSQLSIEKYEHAVADASFLQIFSPLVGAQSAEYDNYQKRQKTLALGYFSVHYGSFGTALLQLPRRDILRYSSLRYVARCFRDFLCFGGDDPRFRVPWGDPAFERLDPAEKDRLVDARFEAYVAWRAQEEESADEKGVFTAIQNQKTPAGKDLRALFTDRLKDIWGRLDELVQIPDIERQAINPGNPSLARPLAVLRKEYGESRARVRGQYLEALLTDLRTGRFFTQFFKDNLVNPISQRVFLIRLLREAFVHPFEDPLEGEFLKAEGTTADLDSSSVQEEIQRIEADLARNSSQGFIGRIVDSENKGFQGAKLRAIRKYDELAQDHRDELRRYFWRSFEAELRRVGEAMLGAFRKVAEVADEQARLAEAECERFRRDPGAWPDSDVATYYLDFEVMRDDRRRERLWHLFYQHQLDRSAWFDVQAIFRTVTSAFLPVQDPDGRLRARDAGEIVASVKEQLGVQARDVYTRALEDLGLDLASGLDLEQRYVALLDAGADFAALRAQGRLDDEIRRVPIERVRQGIQDRFRRLADECVVLAHIDAARQDDPTVTPAMVFYAGLDERYATDEPGALGNLLGSVVSGLSFVTGWQERDSMVLYRAILGIPIYWYRNVEAELQPAYRKVAANPARSYPLHIEAVWEKNPGLPDLDPIELKRAQDREVVEKAAARVREARAERLRAFILASLFGSVSRDESGYSWNVGGRQGALGATRSAAFLAFEAIHPGFREEMDKRARAEWERLHSQKATRVRLADLLQTHDNRLFDEMAGAMADGRDADLTFLNEEKEVLSAMKEMGG